MRATQENLDVEADDVRLLVVKLIQSMLSDNAHSGASHRIELLGISIQQDGLPMRATLREISPNDTLDWEKTEGPWDAFGWFSLSIGPEGNEGSEYFQVLVATPAAVSRAKGPTGRFRGVIVDSFEPDVIAKTLHDYVSSIEGHTWHDLVEKLMENMLWEYEGMPAYPPPPKRAKKF